jgi:hypothetical protein
MDRVAKGRVTTIPFVLKVEIWPFVSALNVLRNMSLCVVATESPTITNVSSSGKPVSRKQTLPSSKTHLAVSQFRLYTKIQKDEQVGTVGTHLLVLWALEESIDGVSCVWWRRSHL